VKIAAAHFGVAALRDVDFETYSHHAGELGPAVAKRARHIITENARTEAAAEALANDDLATMGELMARSHVSMRDDFEITVPPIDTLVEIAAAVIGPNGGARMTGGGFGGCIVALAPQEAVADIKNAIDRKYPEACGLQAAVYVCSASAGAGRC